MPADPRSQIPYPKSLRPPQFGLRTLLLVVTACGVLLALRHWFAMPPIAIAAIMLLVLSIFCHVAGNVIGTRLRAIGDRPETPIGEFLSSPCPQASDFAPVTRLSQRQGLGTLILVVVPAGALLGAVGGGVWTLVASPGPAGLPNVAVGMVAFGILGGLAAFGTVALAQVMLGALWQAMNSPQKTAPVASEVESSSSILQVDSTPPPCSDPQMPER